ncbi:MAG: isoprenylcysteine carboxylmethyltransferase family protein [Deltaproteobacteria bacterium]|nr:isoprenylcysteine carboxylmethyltransferase family protein [Deltaproteobacteria bacterium]
MERQQTPSKESKTVHEKWFDQRDDLTGEYKWGDMGQGICALLFFGVWITDSFVFHYSTRLNEMVPELIRILTGLVILCSSAYLAWSGLKTVFHEVRETPTVIRKGIFRIVRHPIYLSEVLLYLGLFIISMSIAACVVWIGAVIFLYYLSRYEEKLLLNRFGEDYKAYMNEVGMWLPRIKRG